MRPTISLAALSAVLALSACATTAMPSAIVATGPLATATGEPRGTVNLSQGDGGLTLLVEVVGMDPGTYGAHVHTVGRCEAPAFASAGPHWNPTARQHGRLNPAGSHHGDLPNLVIASNGRGRIESPLEGTFTGDGGLFDADGAALVVHARPDDERTDPSGNSGDRIACAVLARR